MKVTVLALVGVLAALEGAQAANFTNRNREGRDISKPESTHVLWQSSDADTHFVLVDTLDLPAEFHAHPGQFSRDGLAYYLALSRGSGPESIYVLSRASVRDPFGPPELLTGSINEPPDSLPFTCEPSITANGKTLVFVRSDGSWSGNDLYVATRVDTSVPFDSVRPLDEVNVSGAGDGYPWISPDGLTLYYSQGNSMAVTSRESTQGRFGSPRPLPVRGEGDLFSPWLTGDELEIYFVDRPNICYAWRNSPDDSFSTPAVHPEFGGFGFVSGLSTFGEECYVYNNDQQDSRILMFVPAMEGVEEGPTAQVRMPHAATVVRGLPAGAVAFDAMGRRVVNPKSGVYFVRAASGKLSAVSCQKVVLQR